MFRQTFFSSWLSRCNRYLWISGIQRLPGSRKLRQSGSSIVCAFSGICCCCSANIMCRYVRVVQWRQFSPAEISFVCLPCTITCLFYELIKVRFLKSYHLRVTKLFFEIFAIQGHLSLHLNKLFSAKAVFYLKLRISQFLSNAIAFNLSSGSTATGVVTISSNEISLCESL